MRRAGRASRCRCRGRDAAVDGVCVKGLVLRAGGDPAGALARERGIRRVIRNPSYPGI